MFGRVTERRVRERETQKHLPYIGSLPKWPELDQAKVKRLEFQRRNTKPGKCNEHSHKPHTVKVKIKNGSGEEFLPIYMSRIGWQIRRLKRKD